MEITSIRKNRKNDRLSGKPVSKSEVENAELFRQTDWYLANQETNKKFKALLETAPTSEFRQLLWPFAIDPPGLSHLISIVGCKFHGVLNQEPFWFVRDGILPLLWFFKQNPEPQFFRSKLLIESSLAPLVPAAWRERVGTYRMAQIKDAPTISKRTNLLLSGLVGNQFNSVSNIQSRIKWAEATIGSEQFRSLTKKLFLLERSAFSIVSLNAYPESLLSIVSELDLSTIDVIGWKSLEYKTDFQEWTLLDLNERYLHAFNYLTHHCLSRGATALDIPTVDASNLEDEEFLALSPFHGFAYSLGALDNNPTCTIPTQVFKDSVSQACCSRAAVTFPWLSWIQAWHPTSN